MKVKSIKKRLIVTFVLIILLPMSITAVVSNSILSSTLKKAYVSSIEKSVVGVNSVIDEIYNGYEATLAQLTENSVAKSALDSQKAETVKKELNGLIKSNAKILNGYIATENGSMYIYPDTKLPEGYDPRVKSWYKSSLSNNNKVLWQDAYKDIATGKVVVTATKAILDNSGQPIGVSGIDIDVTNIAQLFNDTKIEETGEIMLLDRTGIAIATKNKDLIGKNLNPDRVNTNADTQNEKIENGFNDPKEVSWMEDLMSGKSQFTQTKFDGKNSFIYYTNNTNPVGSL